MNPSGYPADRPVEARPSFGRGRVCSRRGCHTELSMYNPGKFCSEHPDPRDIVFPTRQATSAALGGGRRKAQEGAT